MRIMAILAIGDAVEARFERQAMDAGTIALALAFVARPAIGGLGRDVVVGMFGRQIGMAADTSVGPVDRGGELGSVHKQRDFLSRGVRFGERFVRMAFKTGTVLYRLGRRRRRCPHAQEKPWAR